MAGCPKCGHECGPSARFCEKCGEHLPESAPVVPATPPTRPDDGFSGPSKGGWIALGVIAVVLLFVALANLSNDMLADSPRSETASRVPSRSYLYRYAHGAINVREGRGTTFAVVGKVARGARVEVDSLRDGWYACYRADRKWGYVYADLLHTSGLPDFEIVSWNWRKDCDFGVDGAVIWTVELRNNTSEYVRHVRVRFTSYDAAGNVVDSDWTYVSGLSPGSTASAKSYATYYGTEQKGRVQVIPD